MIEATSSGQGVGHTDAKAHRGGKLVSPSRRRQAVEQLQNAYSVSERRACKVVGQARSSQRYEASPRDDERPVVARMLELVEKFPRYGYRRITALLRQERW